MMSPFILQVTFGIILLFAGGELLVRGAVGAARKLRMSAAAIGLTIVAYGTSAPELVVSLQAAATGSPDIALGNVIGSNISNILLVLGITGLLLPVAIAPDLLKRDGGIMLGASVLLLLLCADGQLSRTDGLLLIAGAIAYTAYVWRSAAHRLAPPERDIKEKNCTLCAIAYIAVGLGLLTTGADIVIDGASALAAALGVSEAVIGLTIVAVGTSAPEMLTTIIACCRRHGELGVGNIIGSCIFNILAIAGITAAVTPITVAGRFVHTDLWLMIAITVLALAFMRTHRTVSRVEGAVLVALYVFYGVYQYAFANA